MATAPQPRPPSGGRPGRAWRLVSVLVWAVVVLGAELAASYSQHGERAPQTTGSRWLPGAAAWELWSGVGDTVVVYENLAQVQGGWHSLATWDMNVCGNVGGTIALLDAGAGTVNVALCDMAHIPSLPSNPNTTFGPSCWSVGALSATSQLIVNSPVLADRSTIGLLYASLLPEADSGTQLQATMVPTDPLTWAATISQWLAVSTILWLLLLCFWLWNCRQHWSNVNAHFAFIGANIIIHFTKAAVVGLCWIGNISTGRCHDPRDTAVCWPLMALECLCQAFMICELLHIAKGWVISRKYLPFKSLRNVIGISIIVFSFCMVAGWVSWQASLIMIVALWGCLLAYASWTMEGAARGSKFHSRRMQPNSSLLSNVRQLVQRQIDLIRIVRIPGFVYLIITGLGWGMLDWSNMDWVWTSTVYVDIADLLMLGLIAYLLRLRQNSPYWFLDFRKSTQQQPPEDDTPQA